jgi:4'-phosphopantetheinyl transferase EntD
MAALAPHGVLVGCRAIGPGDENLLLAEERRVVTTHNLAARRSSGAARHLARALLATHGYPTGPIGRSAHGAPLWAEGVVGSLAHDDMVAVAAVARATDWRALGIDVEPAEPLPADLGQLVMTAEDVPDAIGDVLTGRMIFAAKEAVYKAVHLLDGAILNYDDITIDLPARDARTSTGHVATLFVCTHPRIAVLATIAR